MVELSVLADGLASCAKCGIPLHLTHTVDILRVMCQNMTCQHKNIIPTGKRHGRIWDANTKLAVGIIIPPVLIFISFVG